MFSQYCKAILSATSTAIDPESAKKTRVRPRRGHRGQPLGQHERRLMRQSAEHHMRHRGELSLDGLADMRMVVPVAGAPPGRDAIDQLAAVGQDDPAALGPDHGQRRRRHLHLAIRQPDVGKTQFKPVRMISCGRLGCAHVRFRDCRGRGDRGRSRRARYAIAPGRARRAWAGRITGGFVPRIDRCSRPYRRVRRYRVTRKRRSR